MFCSPSTKSASQECSLEVPQGPAKIWYFTDILVFRIHKGVLAACSSVFKTCSNLFALVYYVYTRRERQLDSDYWNGVPVVRSATGATSGSSVHCTSEAIRLLLGMRSKYNFTDLRDEVLTSL